ncbi:hypothetical protein SDC9_141412 [bioreactor metagenome]|uniref:Uncharacterized protein n=1 Tax=bioreactor metagenome TaxID=1076179 RepID=A0A645DY48_9ZZZZ
MLQGWLAAGDHHGGEQPRALLQVLQHRLLLQDRRFPSEDMRVMAIDAIQVAIWRKDDRTRLSGIIDKRCFLKPCNEHLTLDPFFTLYGTLPIILAYSSEKSWRYAGFAHLQSINRIVPFD